MSKTAMQGIHDKDWFIERVGKRVYRDPSTCDCEVCREVEKNGIIINDKFHAIYMYDCQNELDLIYYDQQPSPNKQLFNMTEQSKQQIEENSKHICPYNNQPCESLACGVGHSGVCNTLELLKHGPPINTTDDAKEATSWQYCEAECNKNKVLIEASELLLDKYEELMKKYQALTLEGSESYWKKRCEAAEAVVMQWNSLGKVVREELLHKWQQLKSSIGEETEGQDG